MHPMRKLIAAVALALPITPGVALAADHSWTLQASVPAGELSFGIMKDFTDSLPTLTGGRLEVRLAPVGAIVQYSDTLDAVGAGVLDGHITGPMYFAGKDPAFALLGDLIAAYEHSSQLLAFLEYGGGTDMLRELYAGYGVHTIGVITPGKEAFVSKVPVRSVADFAGIKLRAPEGMAQDVFGRIGASPVNLAAAEVYTALERGVIDAADWATFSMNQRMGFHAIAKFPIYPGIHSMPVIDVSVNQDRWDALPADIQAILTTAVRDFARDFAQRIELADQDDLALARADDIEIIDWPADEREKLRLIAVEVWREWAGRSAMGRRAFDAHMAFLTRIGLIR